MAPGPEEFSGPDPICRDDPYPRYEEAICDVICANAVTYPDPHFRAKGQDGVTRPTWKCRLECFRVVDQQPVCGFFNLGNEAHPEPRPGSEYRRVWIMANDVAPRKRQRLIKRVFKGKVFRVKIADTLKDSKGRAHPEGAVYSTIKEFVARVGP